MRRMVLLALTAGTLTGCSDLPTAVPATASEPPQLLLVPAFYVEVSAGAYHTCTREEDGSVACWGGNGDGQTSVPAGLVGATEVGAGAYHTCAVKSDGSVACWGGNGDGQTSVPAGLTGVTQVSVGYYHTCTLKEDGSIACWGANGFAQSTAPDGLTGVTQVSAGGNHTCAGKSDGSVACWGSNSSGQSTAPSDLTEVTQVSAGWVHTCAVKSDGSVACWGYNGLGQTTVPGSLTGVTQVSAGLHHTCAVKSDGSVACWGWNEDGQSTVPGGLTGVTQVSAGWLHTCAVKSDDSVACWGSNGYGQSTVPASPRIHPTATFTHPASVVAGQPFTLSLTDAQVPGHPEATTFTYAFDCGEGSGLGAFGASSIASCPTSTAGTRSVRGLVRDHDGDETAYTGTVEVTQGPSGFSFTGFFAPVQNLPALNEVKAGKSVPVKFSLGGDQGLEIFAAGFPATQPIACDQDAYQAPVTGMGSTGASSLSYDAAADQYTYVWKTEKGWANSCRQLLVRLSDGSEHRAEFRFTR